MEHSNKKLSQHSKQIVKKTVDVSAVSFENCIDMTEAQAAKGSQLSGLKKHPEGEQYLNAFIARCIFDAAKLVKIEADGGTVVLWSKMIAKKYWYFKAEELVKAFLNGASGKQFGVVDFSDLCEWLNQYEQGKLNRNEHNATQHKEGFQPREKTDPKAILLSVNELKQLGKL